MSRNRPDVWLLPGLGGRPRDPPCLRREGRAQQHAVAHARTEPQEGRYGLLAAVASRGSRTRRIQCAKRCANQSPRAQTQRNRRNRKYAISLTQRYRPTLTKAPWLLWGSEGRRFKSGRPDHSTRLSLRRLNRPTGEFTLTVCVTPGPACIWPGALRSSRFRPREAGQPPSFCSACTGTSCRPSTRGYTNAPSRAPCASYSRP